MNQIKGLMLAVTVVVGWTLALVWLVTSVSQIAVERVMTPPMCVAAPAGGSTCSR